MPEGLETAAWVHKKRAEGSNRLENAAWVHKKRAEGSNPISDAGSEKVSENYAGPPFSMDDISAKRASQGAVPRVQILQNR